MALRIRSFTVSGERSWKSPQGSWKFCDQSYSNGNRLPSNTKRLAFFPNRSQKSLTQLQNSSDRPRIFCHRSQERAIDGRIPSIVCGHSAEFRRKSAVLRTKRPELWCLGPNVCIRSANVPAETGNHRHRKAKLRPESGSGALLPAVYSLSLRNSAEQPACSATHLNSRKLTVLNLPRIRRGNCRGAARLRGLPKRELPAGDPLNLIRLIPAKEASAHTICAYFSQPCTRLCRAFSFPQEFRTHGHDRT